MRCTGLTQNKTEMQMWKVSVHAIFGLLLMFGEFQGLVHVCLNPFFNNVFGMCTLYKSLILLYTESCMC